MGGGAELLLLGGGRVCGVGLLLGDLSRKGGWGEVERKRAGCEGRPRSTFVSFRPRP